MILTGANIDIGAYPNPVGFEIQSSHTIVRGFAIDGFDVGIKVDPGDSVDPHNGVLIQGNAIGSYILYPVDPTNGMPVVSANSNILAGRGCTAQGVVLGATNTTLGGTSAQQSNVITQCSGQGVWVQSGAVGNQIVNNQIGVIGPSSAGYYAINGNGAEGVWIEGQGESFGETQGGSTNVVSANLISGNLGDGVHISGPIATDNRVSGNWIGLAPGGGYRFGSGDPGNGGDGVRIDDAPGNVIGGMSAAQGNVIASNDGAGIRIHGAGASENLAAFNLIGLVADGTEVLGNQMEGVSIENDAAHNQIGPSNVISGNLRGVLITGPDTGYNTVHDNMIGTDPSGTDDFGNAKEGVRIDGAPFNSILGDNKGAQLISGNDLGIAILGATATGNTVQGNWIGLDKSGLVRLGNSQQGVLIDDVPNNQIGGTTTATGNKIIGNHWGLVLRDANATGNVVEGNEIGFSELQGVLIDRNASWNMIGGLDPAAGNTIHDNAGDGVRALSGVSNAFLSNQIYHDGGLGIDLGGDGVTPNNPSPPGDGPNWLQNYPDLAVALTDGTRVHLEGSFQGLANTDYTFQIFQSVTASLSHYGEGQTLVQTLTITTDDAGQYAIDLDLGGSVPIGRFLTATATLLAPDLASGDTSEFSRAVATQTATINFSAAKYQVREDSGQIAITVKLDKPFGAEVDVQYATSNGTALAGKNYTAVSGTVTFLPGETQKTFLVPVLHDPHITGDLTVNLTLSQPSVGAVLGTLSTATLTIQDVEHYNVHFLAAATAVNEDAGSLVITVRRDGNTGPASVDYKTVPITAVPGVDYQTTTGTLNFAAGEVSKTITLPVLHNFGSTSDHTVNLVLSNPVNLALGTPNIETITIKDVDRSGFQFDKASYSISESVPTITLTVQRNGPTTTASSINYTTVSGTAGAGVDFRSTAGTLTFNVNEKSKTIVVPILDRHLSGGSAVFQVQLMTSVGVNVATASVTIQYDEPDRTPPQVTNVQT